MLRWASNAGLWLSLITAGCSTPPAGPPLRPMEKLEESTADCAKQTSAPPSVPYSERRIGEGSKFASLGVRELTTSKNLGASARYFQLSLKADPYNVHATYNLAATYALAGKQKCSLTLLQRILDLRSLASYKAESTKKLKLLLDEGDPDFNGIRASAAFQAFAKRTTNE